MAKYQQISKGGTGGYLICKPEKDSFKDGKPAWEIVDKLNAQRPCRPM
jgi:hypothetical protein